LSLVDIDATEETRLPVADYNPYSLVRRPLLNRDIGQRRVQVASIGNTPSVNR
jgi:hypothetical protein